MSLDRDYEQSVKELQEMVNSGRLDGHQALRSNLMEFLDKLERREFTTDTNMFMFDQIMRPSLSIRDEQLGSDLQTHLLAVIESKTYQNPVDQATINDMYAKGLDEIIDNLKTNFESVTNKRDTQKFTALLDVLEALKTADQSPVFDSRGRKIGVVPTPPELKIPYAVRLIENAIEMEKRQFTKSSLFLLGGKSADKFIQAASDGKLKYAKALVESLHSALNGNRSIDRSPLLSYTDQIAETRLQSRTPAQKIKL
ncbi:hypothetical protein AQUSIP_07690 [Aquicella siphonis]|uniref:Uncharacterized protein n=1 Tax=Aquicella siphonis TaxID=254247 RepID=A0A5E4PER8_9COXI|nr:hypothetical protein [Aquicella siphonis]VVC75479.1 hypothetical protein AQUSIP_07690 [Aquicella siphonis]